MSEGAPTMNCSESPRIDAYRYEIKFILEPDHVSAFEQWALARPMVRRAFPARTINSIYFDTAEYRSALDNIKGVANRKKFRIRWYEDNTAGRSDAAFEIKVKTGRLGRKHVAPLVSLPSDMDPLTLNAHDLGDRLFSDSGVLELIPDESVLLPVVHVRYERQYLAAQAGIRMTVDRDLAFRDYVRSGAMLSSDAATYGKTIVEFKFGVSGKDEAAELMQTLPFYPVRSSKYLLGLSVTGKAVYL